MRKKGLYLIAELGVNYYDVAKQRGISNLDAALLMCDEAKRADIDAVKFQTYKAGKIASKYSPSYWDLNEESTRSQYELFLKYDSFGEKEYKVISEYCRKIGIEFFSTPFDFESADYLDQYMNYYKISSSDITNIPFIEHIAKKGKAILLSTGASTLDEIRKAVEAIRKMNNQKIVLMHCVLEYPTPKEHANLYRITALRQAFPDLEIGYSDHTKPDYEYDILKSAYLLGAHVIEKHFTLDKSLPGNDHYHAMDVSDALQIKKKIKQLDMICGEGFIDCLQNEEQARKNARRSIVLKRNIEKGEILKKEDLVFKRPGIGIPPYEIAFVTGKKVNKFLEEDSILHWTDLEAQNIPINKGNYYLETSNRMELFEQYRSEGWEKEYQQYRSAWVENAKKQYVSDWPLLVDIETSSLCNLKCPMCYTTTEEFKEKVCAKLMSEDLFYKIIDEISGKVCAVRLSLRGEPTLHPQLIQFIKYAKEKGIKEVSFLTNGSRLSDIYIRKLIEAGVDWITISIDGLREEYENIRKPLLFKDIYQTVKRFKEIKNEMNSHKPVIKIQGIWPAIRDHVEEYYNLFKPITDSVAFNPLIDYLDLDKEIVYDESFSCPQLYQRIIVAADGKVLMCSNDEENMNIIGDLYKEKLYDIWHGEKLNNIRKVMKMPCGFKEIPVCRKCYLPRATDENEKAYVNGREIIIKNYTGRSQKIGE